MAGHAHRVGIASVEVDVAAVDGLRFQGEVADWVHGRLLPEIESVLDAFPETGGRVMLDRLDLVLEAGSRGDWQDRAVSGVRAALADALRRKLTDLGGAAAATLTEGEAVALALAHYLEHGALPWNWPAADAGELRERLESWLGDSTPGTFPSRALSRLAPSLGTAAARRRFLSLPGGIPGRILRAVFGIEPSRLERWERDLARLGSHRSGMPTASSIPRIRMEDLLDALLEEGSTRTTMTESDQELVVARAVVRHASASRVAQAPRGNEEFESIAFRSVRTPMEIPSAIAASDDTVPGAEADDRVAHPPSSEAGAGARVEPRGEEPARPAQERRDQARIAEEGFHVSNAGLILLGPYLPMLFGRVGLDLSPSGSLSTSPTTLSAAMVLLHFLATGRDDPAEFELVLPKVLCGLLPQDSFESPVGLDSDARAEADQLLASALDHWGALKDSSIDGLREGFLVREGKLSLRDGIWRLQVEQKPWDMLLEQLPWSIQFTKFPWMAHPLKTEWMQ